MRLAINPLPAYPSGLIQPSATRETISSKTCRLDLPGHISRRASAKKHELRLVKFSRSGRAPRTNSTEFKRLAGRRCVVEPNLLDSVYPRLPVVVGVVKAETAS
jgi:hypothetical protein